MKNARLLILATFVILACEPGGTANPGGGAAYAGPPGTVHFGDYNIACSPGGSMQYEYVTVSHPDYPGSCQLYVSRMCGGITWLSWNVATCQYSYSSWDAEQGKSCTGQVSCSNMNSTASCRVDSYTQTCV